MKKLEKSDKLRVAVGTTAYMWQYTHKSEQQVIAIMGPKVEFKEAKRVISDVRTPGRYWRLRK